MIIIKIIKFVKDNNIKYIFFESLMSPKFSETIANETGAKTLVLNPIAGLTKEEIEKLPKGKKLSKFIPSKK